MSRYKLTTNRREALYLLFVLNIFLFAGFILGDKYGHILFNSQQNINLEMYAHDAYRMLVIKSSIEDNNINKYQYVIDEAINNKIFTLYSYISNRSINDRECEALSYFIDGMNRENLNEYDNIKDLNRIYNEECL